MYFLRFLAASAFLTVLCAQRADRPAASQTGLAAQAVTPTRSRPWYVSPSGSTAGDGSIQNPWDLQTALNQPPGVGAGDTIWLRGGTYTGTFISKLVGEPDLPIIVRSYPGEWAVLDRAATGLFPTTLQIDGSGAWFWGFEVTNSNPIRSIPTTGSNPLDGRAQGITINTGNNIKLINLVVHDSGDGIADNNATSNNEIYGSLVYHNGWLAPDRGHGQGIYAQNPGPRKRLVDNILFSGFNQGIQVYGSANAYLNNFEIIGNISFNSGMLEGYYERNMLVGGLGQDPSHCMNPLIANNYSYYSTYPEYGPGVPLNVGYVAGCTNPVVQNNYLYSTNVISNNQNLSMTGNTFLGALQVTGNTPSDNLSSYPGNSNIPLGIRPTGVVTFVRPNQYEPGRANVAVFNWTGQSSVNVDLSGVLRSGAEYEVRDAQNFFGPPIATGTYTGGMIAIPMTSTAMAAPVGTVTSVYFHTTREFGAFVVLPSGTAIRRIPPAPRPRP